MRPLPSPRLGGWNRVCRPSRAGWGPSERTPWIHAGKTQGGVWKSFLHPAPTRHGFIRAFARIIDEHHFSPPLGFSVWLFFNWRIIAFLAQLAKNLPAVWETWVWSLDWDDPLEKGKAIHSSILAWRIPSPWSHKKLDTTEQLSLCNWFIGYMVALQCCVSFCWVTKWMDQLHAYLILSFLDFLPIMVTTEHWVEFPVLNNRFSLGICFMY